MQKIEISLKTIIFTLILLIGLKFVWIVKDLLLSLFIAFILTAALRPFVQNLHKRKVPRSLAVFVVYLTFIGIFFYLFSLIVPPLFSETSLFLRHFPIILESLLPRIPDFIQLDSLTQYLPNITGGFFQLVRAVFSNIVFMISTLFFGFYFLLEEDVVNSLLGNFLSGDKIDEISRVVRAAEIRLNKWFWGEIVLMSVVGLFTFLGLQVIGLRFALPLAVLAGILEVVPNIGPVMSAIPAVILGFSQSYFLGLAAIALYVVVQQFENHVIVPFVMNRAVGLRPAMTLIALIIGGKLAGTLGILVSVPLMLCLETVFMNYLKTNKVAKKTPVV